MSRVPHSEPELPMDSVQYMCIFPLKFQMFHSCEKSWSIAWKNPVLTRNAVLLHLITRIFALLSVKWSLREVNNKRKFQIFISKSGRSRLREVPNVVIWLGNFWYFRKLQGGSLRDVVATGGSTVGHNLILSYIYFLLWFGEQEQLVRKDEQMGREGRRGGGGWGGRRFTHLLISEW